MADLASLALLHSNVQCPLAVARQPYLGTSTEITVYLDNKQHLAEQVNKTTNTNLVNEIQRAHLKYQ